MNYIALCIFLTILIIILLLYKFYFIEKLKKINDIIFLFIKKINYIIIFLKKIKNSYYFQIQNFIYPLIVYKAMIKIKNEFSEDEFDKIIQKRLKKYRITYSDKNEIKSNKFLLYRDGNIEFFINHPQRFINCFKRVWLWIPAPLWILFDFIFIYKYCFGNADGKILFCLFFFFMVISFSFLYNIGDHLNNIVKFNFGFEIFSRWIFVFFPYIILFYKFILYFYRENHIVKSIFIPYNILFLFIISLIFFYWYEGKCSFSEYLETLPDKVNLYHEEFRDIIFGSHCPVFWLITNISLENTLNFDKKLLNYYYFYFFEKFDKKNSKNRIKDFLEKLKLKFGFDIDKSTEKIPNKLYELKMKSIDKDNQNLLVPYVVYPPLSTHKSSDYCLINFFENRILCINLVKDVIDVLVQHNDLWKAKKIEDIRLSYLKYHDLIISRMEKDILSPINPLIDPSILDKKIFEIKSYISSLIRINGLLFILRDICKDKSSKSIITKMIIKIEELRDVFDEFLEKSSIILEAENTIKISKLNKLVLFLTALILFTGSIKINLFPININLVIFNDKMLSMSNLILNFTKEFISFSGFTIVCFNILIIIFLRDANKKKYWIFQGIFYMIFIFLRFLYEFRLIHFG